MRAGECLVLRTCNSELKSYGGFQWKRKGNVVAPDWDPEPVCGKGLHGALWGEGYGSLFDWSEDAVWMVVAVWRKDIVDLKGKVKFPRCRVVFCGDREGATKYLAERAPGRAIIGGTATAGDYGTATAGDYGTATAGYDGTATAGYDGTATAGDYGTATAGDRGTATAGYGGTATAGYRGTATAGDYGTATAGYGGTISIHYWDASDRRRIVVGYIGEGLEPNTPYRLEDGKFVEVDRG